MRPQALLDPTSNNSNLKKCHHLTICLNAKSSEEHVVYKKLNSTGTLIQRTTTEAPQRTYVLHRTGCSQEDNQLLRQGCQRSGPAGRQDRSNATRTRRLDEDSSATMDSGYGSNDFHRLDLRSPASACATGQKCASADFTRPRSTEGAERSD